MYLIQPAHRHSFNESGIGLHYEKNICNTARNKKITADNNLMLLNQILIKLRRSCRLQDNNECSLHESMSQHGLASASTYR